MILEQKNMNIPTISVTDLVELLVNLYSGAIGAGIPLKALPTPFLWGAAGIGKSDGIRELGDALHLATDKKVVITDVRLLLFSPIDLRGVPVADENRQFTNWLMPRIFNMDASESVINILFLDELSAAPQSVQAAAYQITLDRRIGEHILPDNCIVIAAGNRTTDQSVAYKMPKALCNRLMHYNVRCDFTSWKAWAIKNKIDSRIIGYLSFDNSKLCIEPEASEMAYPTPRSWSFVSNILRASASKEHRLEVHHDLLSACIGTDTAITFEAWADVYQHLPSVDDIMKGTCRTYPKTQDVLYALCASLVEALQQKGDGVGQNELEHVCAYAARFPADFAMSFFMDVNSIPGIKLKLMKCRALQGWLSANKKYL